MTIPIVDMTDTIIEHKDRLDIDYDVDIFRTASLWITNSRGEILLAQRKHNKIVDPDKWAEAVGGTVEGEDSYEATVIREAEEELGIKNLKIRKGPRQFITVPYKYFVQWYTTVVDKPVDAFIVQQDEVEKVSWISRAQLENELRNHPDKYIAAMPEILALFP